MNGNIQAIDVTYLHNSIYISNISTIIITKETGDGVVMEQKYLSPGVSSDIF